MPEIPERFFTLAFLCESQHEIVLFDTLGEKLMTIQKDEIFGDD